MITKFFWVFIISLSALFVASNGQAKIRCESLFEFKKEVVFEHSGLSQQAAGLERADTACGQVCVVKLIDVVLKQFGLERIANPIAEANHLGRFRIFDPEKGSSYEETISMVRALSEKFVPAEVRATAVLLDDPVNPGDPTIPRRSELTPSDLSKTRAATSETKLDNNFDILGFAILHDGKLVGGHGILVLDKDPRTGNLTIFDPNIGKRAVVALEQDTVGGRKLTFLKIVRSEEDDSYWKMYTAYGPLVLTGVLTAEFSTDFR